MPNGQFYSFMVDIAFQMTVNEANFEPIYYIRQYLVFESEL